MKDRKKKLYEKVKFVLTRKRAAAKSLGEIFTKINQIVRGWINYFRIGSVKVFLKEFGAWLRHKIRVVILKQWKRPRTIYKNLMTLNKKLKANYNDNDIFKAANSRLGLYKKANGDVVNFLISPKLLETKTKDRPGLVNPSEYYLSK